MARPSREVNIHSCFLEKQAKKVKSAINSLTQQDNLSAEDIHAVKVLAEVYESLLNPVSEIQKCNELKKQPE